MRTDCHGPKKPSGTRAVPLGQPGSARPAGNARNPGPAITDHRLSPFEAESWQRVKAEVQRPAQTPPQARANQEAGRLGAGELALGGGLQIRGPLDAPKFKDYILPLIFLKRLSDVFEDEVAQLAQDFGDVKTAASWSSRTTSSSASTSRRGPLVVHRREVDRPGRAPDGRGAGDRPGEPPALGRDRRDRLQRHGGGTTHRRRRAARALVQVLSHPDYRLGLDDVEPDILGRAYEYLLRKFAEGQGQSPGEFYTPREVAVLMAIILEPEPGMTVYDPCCGSAGLLIKCHLRLLETKGEQTNGHLAFRRGGPARLYGQEINPSTFAIARMNAFLHMMDAEIALGDTLLRPAFKESDSRLRRFDLVAANPMWNQDYATATYENDAYDRFQLGVPPASSADWGWLEHMLSS